MARIAFLTCHLTGTGHLVRTLAFARAALSAGHEAVVITGGRALAHVDHRDVPIAQLPAVVVRGFEFTHLRRPDGELADSDYMATRAARLSTVLHDFRPDVLVTELYPFGRRVLAAEFEHAITIAKKLDPGCIVLASIRDVPEPKPKRLAEVNERLQDVYTGVIVHGDASVLALEEVWPLAPDAMSKIRYAGYLGPAPIQPASKRCETVLVSVGGGVLGRDLLSIATKAAALSDRPWHILVGGADAIELSERLAGSTAVPGLKIEPARRDYRTLLASAACSISLCGYNTAVELALETVPALLVPSEEAGEQEQLIRARAWSRFDGVALMRMHAMTPASLAQKAEELAAAGHRKQLAINVDRGAQAIAVIEGYLDQRADT